MIERHRIVKTKTGEVFNGASLDIELTESKIRIGDRLCAPRDIKIEFPVVGNIRRLSVSVADLTGDDFRAVGTLDFKSAGDLLAAKPLLAIPEVREQFGDAAAVWDRRIKEINPVEIPHAGRELVIQQESQSDYMRRRYDR